MKLSREQQQAVTTVDNNVCVNAGAGSGKTEVLTRRFLEIMQTKQVPIESIVCITFTKKAGFEMKDRIRQLLEAEGFDQNVESLNVSTIHSFCKDIINRYTLQLDLDPSFAVMEENDKKKRVQYLFQKHLHDRAHQPFYDRLMRAMALKDFKSLKDFLGDFYQLFETFNILPEEIYENVVSRLERIEDFHEEERLWDLLVECLNVLGKREPMAKFLQDYESEIKNREIELTNEFLLQLIEKPGTSKKTQDLRDEVIDLVQKKCAVKEKTYKDLYKDLFSYIQTFHQDFARYKRENSVVDFNDLERLMMQLLQDEEIASEIRQSISYLMVDEFQDTSNLQKEIFQKLTTVDTLYDRKNLFVVGDPKQAIYGFRGANIEIFEQTREEIIASGGISIVFQENFRSQKQIMDTVNVIYQQRIPSYDPLMAMKVEQEPVEVIMDEKEMRKTFSQEAEIFASNIKPSELDDFVALFRTRTRFQELEEALKKFDIPFYSFGTTGFGDCYEVQDFCCFLKYFLWEEEISLVGVLQNYYEMDLQALYEWKKTRDLKEHMAYVDLQSFLLSLRQELYRMDLKTLVWKIFDKYTLFQRYNTCSKNDQAQANLYRIFECACACDTENLNLKDFYDLLEGKSIQEQKQVETQDSKAVKLMTIHSAKGLGFQNVYIPALGARGQIDRTKFRYFKGQFALKFADVDVAFQKLDEEIKRLDEKEEDNLYYTAMTRAKKRLILGATGQKSGYKRVIDPILDRLAERGDVSQLQECDHSDSVFQEEATHRIPVDLRSEKRESKIIRRNVSVTKFLKEISGEDVTDSIRNQATMTAKQGLVIHKFAEIYDGNKTEALQQSLMYYNEDIRMMKQYELYADAFIHLNEGTHQKVQKELPFYAKIKGQVFSGIIDRVEYDEDTVKIIDFKLSYKTKDELERTYALQLTFYGYILEKAYGKHIELELQNLQRGEKISIAYEKWKVQLQSHLDRFIMEG